MEEGEKEEKEQGGTGVGPGQGREGGVGGTRMEGGAGLLSSLPCLAHIISCFAHIMLAKHDSGVYMNFCMTGMPTALPTSLYFLPKQENSACTRRLSNHHHTFYYSISLLFEGRALFASCLPGSFLYTLLVHSCLLSLPTSPAISLSLSQTCICLFSIFFLFPLSSAYIAQRHNCNGSLLTIIKTPHLFAAWPHALPHGRGLCRRAATPLPTTCTFSTYLSRTALPPFMASSEQVVTVLIL